MIARTGAGAGKMKIQKLDNKDHSRVISFALKGMNFEKYIKSKLLLKAHGSFGTLKHPPPTETSPPMRAMVGGAGCCRHEGRTQTLYLL
ncbi:MAG: hypothetical protein ACLUIQ_11575 [Dialister invisus]